MIMKYKKKIIVTLDSDPQNICVDEVTKRLCIMYLEGKLEILDMKLRSIKYKGYPISDKKINKRLH